MKKLFILGLSVAMIAGGASCKKSSKRKMSNDWKVSSAKSEWSNQDGDKRTTTYTETEKTVVDSPNGGTSSTDVYTIGENSWTISKDGTWSSKEVLTHKTTDGNPVSNATATTDEMSGTWSFASKNKSASFKKNERVVFSILKSSSKGENSSSSDTFAEGEMVFVWTIESSKGKELTFKEDTKYTSTSTYSFAGSTTTNNYSSTSTSTTTLVQK